MAITHSEHILSRKSTEGKNRRVELRFTLFGSDDDAALKQYLMNTAAPSSWDGMVPNDYDLEPTESSTTWTGIVTYTPPELQAFQPPQTGETVFNFDTTGATQHITVSGHPTVNRYNPPGGLPADYHGLIGVDADGNAQGADIVARIFNFTVTYYIDKTKMTQSYVRSLFDLTGTVNDAQFTVTIDGVPLVFEAGELLFKGATGGKRGGGDWEIVGHFAASPNATNLKVGEMAGISKKGWDYMWVEYARCEQETGVFAPKRLVATPIQVYIEQLYEYKSFLPLKN